MTALRKQFAVYILSNKRNTVFYIGVTANLTKRIWEHKMQLCDGFTKKYSVDKLIYYELLDGPIEAIQREKQLKGWTRKKKLDLVMQQNSTLSDLYAGIG